MPGEDATYSEEGVSAEILSDDVYESQKDSTYDKTGNGIVDNAELVNGHLVESDVPKGAVFTDTDTVYDDTAIVEAVAQNTAKNTYPAADQNKLSLIEDNATADQTGAEIATLYEGEANKNAFSDSEKAKLAALNVIDDLLSASTTEALSANQGKVLKGFIDAINTLLTSDDTTLDELQEIVTFIKLNKTTLDTLGISNIAGLQDALDAKINTSAIGVSVQAYDAATAKTDTSQTYTKPQRASATVEDNVIDFTATQDYSVTLGALLALTVGTITGTDGQKGEIIVSDTENISGFTGFVWLGTVPTGMTGVGVFSYKIAGSTVYLVKVQNA